MRRGESDIEDGWVGAGDLDLGEAEEEEDEEGGEEGQGVVRPMAGSTVVVRAEHLQQQQQPQNVPSPSHTPQKSAPVVPKDSGP